jgi:hypothetical protein
MKKLILPHIHPGLVILIPALLLAIHGSATSQVKWLAAGSLHNWFSQMGCEIEVGRSSSADQQDGLQWPAWYGYQDCQAAKGLWIGTVNFTDQSNVNYPYKVVHVGPRVRGTGEFIPIKFEMVSKVEPPEILVDGVPALGKDVDNDRVDPTIKPDRMIVNEVNTAIGITMKRTIMQFSQQYHDNYMVMDYVFTNTGNVNADPAIELPNKTLDSVYFYFQYRYSVCADVRYVIGNATSWGKNAMNDARGDGVKPDPPGEQYRAQFVWHGKFPPFTAYDNIGGPIWPGVGDPYDVTDTTGRLGAAQFVGHVTLHADKSTTDSTDDPEQPRTTSWEGSDEPNTSGNDQFNVSRMTDEYTNWIRRGHIKGRHADAVEPQGKFDEPIGDPALGTPGGFSNCDGYGPYRLAPGESIHIVMAEGANGLSRDRCISIGRRFRNNQISAKAKNDSVLTGKDSLFLTFKRAMANYNSGYNIPSQPPPPAFLYVTSGDPISLTWDVFDPGDPNLKGFRVYRATGRYDTEYEMIHEGSPTERSFDDASAIRGVAYYYYVVTVGDPALNTGVGETPQTVLLSNRIYTQTFVPAYLKAKRPAGQTLSDIRIVPNPYSISSDPSALRFSGEPDKIAFFNIPGNCRIRIYTELGELVNEIMHTDGSGDAYWNSISATRQVIVSGIYIVVFEDLDTGERTFRKLAVIR